MADPSYELKAPDIDDVRRAVRNIQSKALKTPLLRLNVDNSRHLPSDVEIYIKLETLQPIGSFKIRPACNAIACITDKTALRSYGVCTASAGNFAQGLAWCCAEEGIPCTVVAPDSAPASKLDEIRRRGGRVLTVPFSEWWEIIRTHQCPLAPGAKFIHPGAENAVLAGNASIAVEILADLPSVDCIVAPYGSGALCTGIAAGVEALQASSRCKVFAAEPATAAPFALSKAHGRVSRFEAWEPSFCDGCGGMAVLEELWPLSNRLLGGGFAVPLEDIAETIKVLVERNRVVAEGAGACAVAAALRGMCGDAKKIVCIVSGAGIDTDKLVHILEGRGVPAVGYRNEKKTDGSSGAFNAAFVRGLLCTAFLYVGGLLLVDRART